MRVEDFRAKRDEIAKFFRDMELKISQLQNIRKILLVPGELELARNNTERMDGRYTTIPSTVVNKFLNERATELENGIRKMEVKLNLLVGEIES